MQKDSNRRLYSDKDEIINPLISECSIRGIFNKFPEFFVQAFKFGVDSWKFSMLSLYTVWDNWLIFMIPDSKEQQQQELENTLRQPDFHN